MRSSQEASRWRVSVDKIIINHGERVTEHELGSSALVIGRDPDCDLFFADKKLSRRHARIERNGPHVRLVDLGSRNGCWVNEERIQERELRPGDEIRLGGLRISYEREPEARTAEVEKEDPAGEATVYLTTEAEGPETATVVLSGDVQEASADSDSSQTVMLTETPPVAMSPDSDDTATVVLSPDAVAPIPDSDSPAVDEGELDETVQRPEPDRTVMLESSPRSPKRAFDTGEVLFRAGAEPSLSHQEAAITLESEEERKEVVSAEGSQSSLTASVTFVPEIGFSKRSWSARFALLVGSLVLFAIFVLAFPLMRIMSPALWEESRLRARTLVDLLAATNQVALGEERLSDLSVERVAREPGVTGAYILSPAGAILAPADRAGQALTLEGWEGSVGDVRNFRSGTSPSGDWLMAQPISYRGRRVGIAVLSQRPPATATGAATLALVVGSILLLMGAAVVILLGRKITVDPIQELRRDVDALVEGEAATLRLERPYGELSFLASSLNRLLDAPLFASREGGEPPGTGSG